MLRPCCLIHSLPHPLLALAEVVGDSSPVFVPAARGDPVLEDLTAVLGPGSVMMSTNRSPSS